MIARLLDDLARTLVRLALQLWPLGLFGFARHAGSSLWRDLVLLPHQDPASPVYLLLYRTWPTAGLAGPAALMLAAISLHKAQLGSRTMAIAGILGTALATFLTLQPEWRRLAPYLGQAALPDILRAADDGILLAVALGVLATGAGVHLLRGLRPARQARPGLVRAPSDTHGHADWLPIREARRLFPGPDPAFGGIVLGEAYRVDQDRTAKGSFNPADRHSWGRGGTAPLLVDPCHDGPTHALVLAGSGGFKTTAVGIPTLLTWTASAVVLDPSREIGPMVQAFRERELGHRTVTLDPGDPASGSFNVLDWIDTASPLAESNLQAVATWLVGEPDRTRPESGREFFRSMGKALIACLLADLLWDSTPGSERSLRRLRQLLVTPEERMREILKRIHATSPSPLARDLAGTLMGLVPETFSGVYANANEATHWLSTRALADLVSGSSFRTAELAKGRLSVFVQIPLKVLHSTPGLGRVVVGALLNAAYEADGEVAGRILFLLDEVARLGPMGSIEAARDAGRKYGLTLLLLYQSVGQLVQQWGREGARAWYDSTSWRLYAAVQDPETARELSALCGEHGVLTSSHGESAGTQGRMGQLAAASAGRSETRSEVRRRLIKPDELLQDIRADEQFVIRRGSRPLRCGRAIYFRRPGMAAVVTPSRFHTRPGSAA